MGFLGTPLGWIMYAIESFVQNYGLSLILFVILTKVVLLPLTIKQQKSTAKTASIQPKLTALQKKCGNDKKRYQEEMMKLYEDEGVNPAGGCLPMLVQFALLFGIIDVIYKPLKHLLRIDPDKIKEAVNLVGVQAGSEIGIINSVQTDPTKFMQIFGAENIEKITNFDMTFMGIDLGGVPPFAWTWLLLIPIISGITAFLMSHLSMQQQAKNGQVMQGPMKYMMYLTPLMSVWFGFTLPAGVGIYWIVSNIVAIIQQYVIGKFYSPERLATMSDKNTEKNREKMRLQREKREMYNKQLEERGLKPKIMPDLPKEKGSLESPDIKEAALKEKEIAKKRLAEARKRAAEKYGDNYTGE